jgi:putative NIF3 family GTP cyclohydrolase 1 type 2
MGLTNVRFMSKKAPVVSHSADGSDTTVEGGEGVIGEFQEQMAADDFIIMLKQQFGVECVMANQLLRRGIKTVALCGGAGAFLLSDAISLGADAFVTGEMHYHDYFGHEQEIQIAILGHYQSEQYTSEIFQEVIERECPGVRCFISSVNTNPIIYL